MRTVKLSHSILFFWQELVFLEAALLASDETTALAAPVTAQLDAFSTTLDTELESRRKITQALARTAVADTDIDEGLRRVHSNTLHLVGQDRKRQEFATLFTGSIGKIVRFALKRQIDVAVEVIDKLALTLYEQGFRSTQIGILQPLIDKGRAVLAERRAAEHKRLSARIEIQDWKQQVNSLRLAVYAELLGMTAATGRKKAWANVFFPSRATRQEADEVDTAAIEAEASGGEAPAEG